MIIASTFRRLMMERSAARAGKMPVLARLKLRMAGAIENLLTALQPPVLPLARRHRLLRGILYGFLSGAFQREHRAVLSGRLRYMAGIDDQSSSAFLLRRNVHRIEKGLLMRPRRDLFAVGYIRETVRAYQRTVEGVEARPDEARPSLIRWAHDVLAEYFLTVGNHPSVEAARQLFRSAPDLHCDRGDRRVPYQRNLSQDPPVLYDHLHALSRHRRSVRWYLPKPVPREFIDKAMSVAGQAPSACNRQPFEFRIYDDPQLVQQIITMPMGTPGFGHNVPVIVVVVGQLRAFFSERDRHVIYIDGSLAAMSFMFALETLGLASCCINWPDVGKREARLAKLLRLEDDERVIMLIALGYPDPNGMVAYSQKQSLEEVRSYNAR